MSSKALQNPKENSPSRGRRAAQADAAKKTNAPLAGILTLQHTVGNRATEALLRPNQEGDAAEQAAAEMAEKSNTGGPSSRPVTAGGQANTNAMPGSIFSASGEKLPGSVRSRFEEQFGNDLSQVRIQRGPQAVQAAEALQARAFTYGQEVAFNTGEYAPHTAAGNALLAHELAHTLGPQPQGVALRQPKNAAKSKAPAGGGKSASTLENIPAAARTNLRVITDPVAKDNIDIEDIFSTKGAATLIAVPDEAKVLYGPSVPKAVQTGLSSVAGILITHTKDLKLNSTLTIALNLSEYGDEYASFRFSFYATFVGKKQSTTILIEKMGKIGGNALPEDQAKAATQKMKNNKFSTRGSWTAAEKERLLAALAIAPDSLLASIPGITFIRQQGDNPQDPNEGGHYNDDSHTITLYDRAFTVSLTRYGKPGSQANDEGMRAILHEIGHALDYKLLRQAWGKYGQSKTKKEIAAGEAGLKSVISPSGQVYQKKEKWEVTEGGKDTAFRTAAKKDSKIPITKYAEKAWEENYAEAFSLYQVAPETLKALRPNVYIYFEQNYPKGK